MSADHPTPASAPRDDSATTKQNPDCCPKCGEGCTLETPIGRRFCPNAHQWRASAPPEPTRTTTEQHEQDLSKTENDQQRAPLTRGRAR